MRTIDQWVNGMAASRTAPIHGFESVRFYTGSKVVPTRWPHITRSVGNSAAIFNFPTSSAEVP